ncbi:MAG TPA: metallophosphoesterase [Opitutaceae bacterium]
MSPIPTRRRFLASMIATATVPYLARGAERAGFEIGLVADAQYADVEPKGTRYYRLGKPRLAAAIEHFNGRPLAFSAHLGDLIDRVWSSFDDMAAPLATSRHTMHQLLGNHDFDVPDEHKAAVFGKMGLKRRYDSFSHGGVRFVLLDTNDVSTYAYTASSPETAQAKERLDRAVAAKVPQAKPWNGALGERQLAWLDRTCAEAREKRERVIILAHHPVYPVDQHNLWNSDEVLAVIDRHPHVVAWFNGHNHAGNYAVRNGVPYLTLRGMVETPDTTAFATARILADRIVLTGHGREPSREMKLRA